MSTLDNTTDTTESIEPLPENVAANDDHDVDAIDIDEVADVSGDAKQFSGQLRRYAIKLVEAQKIEEERLKSSQQGQDNKGRGGGFGLGVPGFLAHRKADSIQSADSAANLIEKMDRMNEMMASATTDSAKAKIRRAISKQGEYLIKHLDSAMTPESMMAAGQRGMKMEDMLAIKDGARKWVSHFDESPDTQSMKEKMEAFFKRIGEMIEKLFKTNPAQDHPNERPE